MSKCHIVGNRIWAHFTLVLITLLPLYKIRLIGGTISRTLVKSVRKIYFSYFSTKTYVVGAQKNRLIEHP